MKQRWNGSIQSSNTPTYDKTGMQREDYALYRCMVIKVLYADDNLNISKNAPNPEVLYDCVIIGGHLTGQTISNCRLAQYLNYSERTLTATSKDISKVRLSQHDGDVVWVEFVQGHDGYPTIIALAKGINDKTAAKKADGPRLIEIYNGLQRNINNKGELITKMSGGSVKEGRFEANKEPMITQSWLSTEQISTVFKSGLKVLEDGKNDVVNIETAGGVKATIDGKGKKITMTTGGTEAVIDGNGTKVTIKAGATEVIIDGNSGKITLKGEMVDLGASVADFVTQFTQLASAFATHTHMYSPGPSPPVPSGPPMAPLLTTVGSQTVKVQP